MLVKPERVSQWLARSPWLLGAWASLAAFGTYFCMYAFRKPFTASSFEPHTLFGVDLKTSLVSAQVLGYFLSKVIGIQLIAITPANRRAISLIVLILTAQISLLLFAVVPAPWNTLFMFLNGLPLGMVFGMVLGFLEGRKLTEAMSAGLCTSFILAGGFCKSIGSWLLQVGISEAWMPFAAGSLFLLPTLATIWMLSCIPPPSPADVEHRSPREPMTQEMQKILLGRCAPGLASIAVVYFLITILRSIRDDFAPELWLAMGTKASPGDFARTDLYVALGVLLLSSLGVLIRDNRIALLSSLAVSAASAMLILFALQGSYGSAPHPMKFMVLVGLGLYIPYVAIHTTVFERLIATTRDRGNIGYLMYLVDSLGYFGYVALMFTKDLLFDSSNILPLFNALCVVTAVSTIGLLGMAIAFFSRLDRKVIGVENAQEIKG